MSLHPSFPTSPYAPLLPEQRWFPAAEDLRASAYDKLLPPLVAKIRAEVFAWRNKGYAGASATSIALLKWWFATDHLLEDADGSLSPFQYYFAQREAVETVIWLHDVKRARDKFDLLRFDASGAVSTGMFSEDWPRYVLKMATGSGKTKVLALLIAWSFFHKVYETESELSRNFLLVAPNIIVLDRLRADFDGLKIFFNDPVLPDNGHEGQNWRDDFQLTLHIQDDVRVVRDTGNIFLTNIHLEAIHQNVVKHPVLPDAASRAKLHERKSAIFSEKYADYLALGVEEWRKSYAEHEPLGKKAVLFVMVDDTKNCDEVGKVLYDSFKVAINALTISDSGSTRIEDYIRLKHTRPFRTESRPFLAAKKCLFNKTVGEANSGGFELSFAVGFKLDYVKADGDLSNYVPDFIVRDTSGVIWIIETKGRKELDLPQKMARLKQWCADATAAEENGQRYDLIFVDQEAFENHKPTTLFSLAASFVEFKAKASNH